MGQSRLSARILAKFSEFREKSMFIDCVIHTGNSQTNAHRLVLAKHSGYFLRLFERPDPPPVFEFTPEFNPQEMLSPVIDWLYSKELIMNEENVVALLAISEFYEIPVLKNIAHHKFQSYWTPIAEDGTGGLNRSGHEKSDYQDLLLRFLKGCSEFRITNYGMELVGPVAEHFSPHPAKIKLIYASVNPDLLAAILTHEKLANLTEDDRLRHVDAYHRMFPVDLENQFVLSKVATWDAEFSHEYLVRHECLWMPSSIIRPLYRRLMKNRRATAHTFRDVAATATGDTSRWFAFTRAQAVFEGRGDPGSVDTIEFMRTLGGVARGFDPVSLGTVSVASSREMRHFPAKAALANRPKEYFISGGTDGQPFLEIHLGPLVQFSPRCVVVACSSPEFIAQKEARFMSRDRSGKEKQLDIRAANEPCLCPVPAGIIISGINGQAQSEMLYNGRYRQTAIDLSHGKPFATLRIGAPAAGKNDPYRFRVFGVELRGEYLP
jgi:hypothetical protein